MAEFENGDCTLDFQLNKLTTLADEIAKVKLQMLSETGLYILSSRELSIVSEAVSDLTEIEELDMQDNYLEELPTSINKLKNLSRLTSEVDQLRKLPQAIAELSKLTVLSVSNNQLSVLPSSN